ncbi:hypothetical protein ACH4MM_06045 [Streptomyces pratensis]|uniref:hypothetical protein n=1 Tax=Streptomyces pratensis TaxID=1169025 RepID=UPI0037B522D0
MMPVIAAAGLFAIVVLPDVAGMSANEVLASANVLLLGLGLWALHAAGIGRGWRAARR